jgi:hypothetical protein
MSLDERRNGWADDWTPSVEPGVTLMEAWGGPLDGQKVRMHDHSALYVCTPHKGMYFRGSGRRSGKLVWKQT